MKNSKNKLAFSLMEITVVLVILSIMLSFAIVATAKILEARQEQKAEKHIDEVREKIERYRVANGRYPCPARLDLTIDDAGFGLEATRTQGGGVTGTACYRDTNAAGTYFPNSISGTFRSGTTINNSILVGAVPVQALGIDRKYATDAWGNKIIYAVTEKLAVDANNRTTDTGDNLVTTGPTAMPDNTNGNIRVEDALTANAIATAANYVVVAPGQDGNGAFNANSTVQSACEADAGDTGFLENNNCDFTNNIFVTSSAMNKTQNNNYFYDIVRWDSFASNDVQISGSASVNNGLSIQGNSLAGASALNVASGGASITGNSAFQGGTTTVANSLVSSGGATFSGGTGATFSAGAGTTTRINNALNSSGGAEFSGAGTRTDVSNELRSTGGATFSGGTATVVNNALDVNNNLDVSGTTNLADLNSTNANIKVTSSGTCGAGNSGRVRFNATANTIEYCNNSGSWVDLKGPQGDKGDKGDKGTDGTNGTNGTNGTTPTASHLSCSWTGWFSGAYPWIAPYGTKQMFCPWPKYIAGIEHGNDGGPLKTDYDDEGFRLYCCKPW